MKSKTNSIKNAKWLIMLSFTVLIFNSNVNAQYHFASTGWVSTWVSDALLRGAGVGIGIVPATSPPFDLEANLDIHSLSVAVNNNPCDGSAIPDIGNLQSFRIINERFNPAVVTNPTAVTPDIMSVWGETVTCANRMAWLLNPSPFFAISGLGKVGIGIDPLPTSPYLLDVKGGDIHTDKNIWADGNLNVTGTGSIGSTLDVIGNTHGHNNLYVDNFLGVGTTSPSSSLDVNGHSHFTRSMGIGVPPPVSTPYNLLLDVGGYSHTNQLLVGTVGSSTIPRTTEIMDVFGTELATSIGIDNFLYVGGAGPVGGGAGIVHILASGPTPAAMTLEGSITGAGSNILDFWTNSGYINSQGPLAINASGSIGSYKLYVNGDAYTTGTSWFTSDMRFKKNITVLNSISDKLFQLNSYSYNFKTQEFAGKKNFDYGMHYGFIAQEVEKIFPNLIRRDTEGYLAINYTEFIPLLLQGLKDEDSIIKQKSSIIVEQETRITNLESQVAEMRNFINDLSKSSVQDYTNNKQIEANKNQNIGSSLSQNIPNPFNDQTKIEFNVVGNYTQAFIGIYDLNGKQIRKINILPKMNEVIFDANQLTNGIYVYSLIIDNIIIDSKKMVISQ